MNIHSKTIEKQSLSFVWLEITGKCQLQCAHCYADSGPHQGNGAMTLDDWKNVIDQVHDLGAKMVQFIGGEPTLYIGLPVLLHYALERGLAVEIFSNLVKISPELWEILKSPGVSLATSYYSDTSSQHDFITKMEGSYQKTKTNILKAVKSSIPIRVGVIHIEKEQNVDGAIEELKSLGVKHIRIDHLRQVGRGIRNQKPDISQLCGHCGQHKIAIASDGVVWPCVFSRWLPVGNIRKQSLKDILCGKTMKNVSTILASEFQRRLADRSKLAIDNSDPCDPVCGPNCSPSCTPSCWPTGAGPCSPNGGCQPNYD